MRTAHRLGIMSKLDPNASIALGTSEVSVMELVSAYVPFANGGIAVAPHVIDKVRTAGGKLIYRAHNPGLGRVIDDRYVAMMNQMMQETLNQRHRAQGGDCGCPGCGQDRYQPGLPRRLVHRLHRATGRRRLAWQ